MDAMGQKIVELFTVYGIKVVAAIIILILGRWIAKGFKKISKKLLEKRDVDPTLVTFVGNLAYIGLMVFFIIAALGQLGIQTTSFIAIIGAAGLAIGLALQGSLSNFAAGFLLIIFKPFKINDFIEAAGTAGTVEKIDIFTTQLKTPDNKTVIIPNKKMTDDNIVNYTVKGTRRVDMTFGIGYSDDIDKAKNIIRDIIENDDRILKDPPLMVAVVNLGESSVDIVARPWAAAGDYWDAYFDIMEKVKKKFDEENISIPFPQRDIHVYQHSPLTD
jgi:small conductance mechanosensitive channel